ncbi:MAG: hypothetical protein V2I97_09795 [Desulfococcaceae bacterium]|jgi:hypothetical protein|nr:hypothetical protein [Desulfococcaceae bacterium]
MDYYRFLDDQINDALNTDLAFNNLLRTEPYKLDPEVVKGFFARYALIKEFQETTLSLFNASLNGEADPEIASLVLNELPEQQGWNYHKELNLKDTPLFFRTDEVVPGKICEIQCPASLWGIYDQLYHFYRHFGFEISSFQKSLSESFADTLTQYLGKTPLIHHLTDHSSIPHDARFFIQQTRKHGLQYFTYDKGVTPYNCNFIRAHIPLGLWTENYASDRLARYKAGKLKYDPPPIILFDEKMLYMFPFWDKTRHYYSDEIRKIFPYTQLITPDGFEMEDGQKIDIENFCKLSQKQRSYYIKYASSDFLIKWGSKGVYLASTFSGIKMRQFFNSIIEDYNKKRYWILQKSYLTDDTATYITRNDETASVNVHSKLSGFYGPEGLMGLLMMQRPFYKVHGNEETVVSICQ